MRFRHLILADLKFQAKYGFYFLYAVLSVVYIIILFALPVSWRQNVAGILIFSDPSALGLFFMGAIILLEKSQRVTCALAVSPVSAAEYVWSKVIALGFVSLAVAAILATFAGSRHMGMVLAGTLLSSILFTLLGIVIGTRIESLNQFLIATIPIEVIGFIPAMLYFLMGADKRFGWYPPNACIDLIAGQMPAGIGIVITIVFIPVLYVTAQKSVEKMWMRMGGVKL